MVNGESVWQAWQQIQKLYHNHPGIFREATFSVQNEFDYRREEGSSVLLRTDSELLSVYQDRIGQLDATVSEDFKRHLTRLSQIEGETCSLRVIKDRSTKDRIGYLVVEDALVVKSGLEPAIYLFRAVGALIKPMIEVATVEQESVAASSVCTFQPPSSEGVDHYIFLWEQVRAIK